jgi:putative DNA primase/helicase
VFQDHEQDHDLAEKLMAELPGIFNWAVEGYRRLKVAEQFTLPKSSARLNADIKRASSGVQQSIEETCALDPDVITTEADLYRAYMAWCTNCGVRRLTASRW